MKSKYDYTPLYDHNDYVQPFSDEQYGEHYGEETQYEGVHNAWELLWSAKEEKIAKSGWWDRGVGIEEAEDRVSKAQLEEKRRHNEVYPDNRGIPFCFKEVNQEVYAPTKNTHLFPVDDDLVV